MMRAAGILVALVSVCLVGCTGEVASINPFSPQAGGASSRVATVASAQEALDAIGRVSDAAAEAIRDAPPIETPFVLAGDWERVNSSFVTLDGMRVRISGNARQALIVSTPSNPFQFQVGDLKWRNITRVSATRFSFEDLVRQSGSGAMSYVPGFIDAQEGGELSVSFPTTGTFQEWRRP